jgi:hypothetical protein
MTYAVTALTATGELNVHSSSSAAIRQALAEAQAQQATRISLTRDGESISESQLGQLSTASTVSVGTALANSAAATETVSKYA